MDSLFQNLGTAFREALFAKLGKLGFQQGAAGSCGELEAGAAGPAGLPTLTPSQLLLPCIFPSSETVELAKTSLRSLPLGVPLPESWREWGATSCSRLDFL